MKYTQKELHDLENATHIIYRITNTLNNKVYIGQTIRTFNKRYEGRKGEIAIERVYRDYVNNIPNKHLLNSINKYGFGVFKVDILKRGLTVEELNYWEELYIALYNSTDNRYGYNYKKGGDNHERVRDYEELKQSLYSKLKNEDEVKFMGKMLLKLEEKKINTRPIIDEIKTRKIVVLDSRDNSKCWVYKNAIEASSIHIGNFRPDTIFIEAKLQCEDGYFSTFPKRKTGTLTFYFFDSIDISEKYVANGARKNKKTSRIDYLPECRKEVKKKKKKYNYKKEATIKTCKRCGKQIKGCKYCADCNRIVQEERKIEKAKQQGKTIKTCPVCGKTHWLDSVFCSHKCNLKHKSLN